MQRTTVQLIDDIDGTVIPEGEGRTIAFALDGAQYQIDLSDDNIGSFKDALAPYIRASRSAGVTRSSRGSSRSSSSASSSKGPGYNVVRAWALAEGIEVSQRGRVASTVIDAYRAAHPGA